MTTDQGIKDEVRKHYASRAKRAEEKASACCGSEEAAAEKEGISSNLYETDELKDLPQEAVVASLGSDAALYSRHGCSFLPTRGMEAAA